jgi:UDP-sugar pyrophosphorylase
MNESQILDLLKELNQIEIIEKYKISNEEEKKNFIEQFNYLEKATPGGIKDYIKRAKILLEESKNNINPFKDYTPEVPLGFDIKVGSDQFYDLDKLGFEQIENTVFVLVAGGLGERLGYPDIKIGIETDLITKRKFIEIYIEYIKAFENRIKKNKKKDENWFIPLCIMTSDDTHNKTLELLNKNKNFGLKENQISIVKQEKCPAILDNECHLALIKDKLILETKPHGHGDIHYLLYKSEKVKNWIKEGKKYLVLFQDTNILSFNCIPSSIGTSIKLNLDINSICVPRKPKDAIGAICKLVKKDGTSITNNVEYNQLDSLLKEKYNKEGDVPNKDGISDFRDFRGNINIIIFKLDTYIKVLEETKGLIPEFVNPKYTDETRTKFKSPTRLECLMQDLPKLLKNGENVGFTSFERWFCFSACKNNLKDACNKLQKNQSPESAFSIEQDIFIYNKKILEIIGKLEIDQTEKENELNIEECKIKFGPKIIIYPEFAPTVTELRDKLLKMKKKIKMTNNSTLILKKDVNIEEGINLDGFYEVEKDEKMVECNNKKYKIYVELKENEGKIYEKIRGYTIKI